ncbi:MAG: hypothetical protein ACOYK1_06220 [Vampirovibrionia bacterium]
MNYYSEYINRAEAKSDRFSSLIKTLREDEDSLAERGILTGSNQFKLNAASRQKIEGLVGNYLSKGSNGELSQISSIYGNTNTVSTSASTSSSALDSLDKTYSAKSLKNFDVEKDIELSKSLTLNLKSSNDVSNKFEDKVSNIFEDKLLNIMGSKLGNATLLKEENINGATVKTYKSATGSEFTVNTQKNGNDVNSTLTYSDGSTLMLRYENGGAGGVAVQRRSAYEAGKPMDYTYVNADVVQQGTCASKIQDNGEQAWVNDYTQVRIKDNSKVDNMTSTYYADGTSTTVWEEKGKSFAGFGSGNNKVYEQYNSDDDFTQAMQKIVGLDRNGIFKGYVDEDDIDLNNPYYGDYRAQIDKRKLEILGSD